MARVDFWCSTTLLGHIARAKFLIAISLLFVITMGRVLQVSGQPICSPDQGFTESSSNWQIQGDSSGATIIWERLLTERDHFVASVQNSAVFYRGAIASECGTGEIVVGLDANTGDESWSLPVALVRSIQPLNDGYLVTACCTTLMRIDPLGEILWHSQSVPERIFEPQLQIVEDDIFFSGDIATYWFSLSDGVLRQTLSGRSIVALYDDMIVENIGGVLVFISATDDDILWILPLEHPEVASEYTIYRYDDTVILSSARGPLEAYDAYSGEEVWTLNQASLAKPIFQDDEIILYTPSNKIEFYDASTGSLRREIALQHRFQAEGEHNDLNSSVELAINDDLLIVSFGDILEMLALRLQS